MSECNPTTQEKPLVECVYRMRHKTYAWCLITLVLTNDVVRSLAKRGIEAQCSAHTHCSGKRIIMAIPFDARPGTMTHESVHASTWILDQSGIPLAVMNDDGTTHTINEESLAYLADELTNWVSAKLQGGPGNQLPRHILYKHQ
jgi:hypothetical protein